MRDQTLVNDLIWSLICAETQSYGKVGDCVGSTLKRLLEACRKDDGQSLVKRLSKIRNLIDWKYGCKDKASIIDESKEFSCSLFLFERIQIHKAGMLASIHGVNRSRDNATCGSLGSCELRAVGRKLSGFLGTRLLHCGG